MNLTWTDTISKIQNTLQRISFKRFLSLLRELEFIFHLLRVEFLGGTEQLDDRFHDDSGIAYNAKKVSSGLKEAVLSFY